MPEHTMKWLAVIASLLFVAWLLLSPSDALKVCEQTHSHDTCIHSLR
ncbi:hypothetical protein [Rhizobium phage RHph_X3_2]|nr:hypothetical protein [Rhizobium phage RHph_X3_2]